MTRIMVWNIERFSWTRIMRDQLVGGLGIQAFQEEQQRTRANRELIEETVQAVDPDVFAVIEVMTSQGAVNQLADGAGPLALQWLCTCLRSNENANWCLVPPLRVNPRDNLADRTYTETVGVFYRSDRVTFTGPYRWPATLTGAPSPSGPPIAPNTGAVAAQYPPPWNTFLPANTNAAACCRFMNGTDEVFFNEEINRRPLCVEFTVTATGHPLRLFIVHLPPTLSATNERARTALSRLTGDMMPNAWRVPPANGTLIIAGDFNIDLCNQDNMWVINEVAERGYSLLRPYPVRIGNHLQLPPSMIESRDVATPGAYLRTKSYDYGLVRWDNAVVPNPVPNFAGLVGDLVAGVPTINAAGPPPVAFGSRMQDALGTISAMDDEGARNRRFRLRANYGRISPPIEGTSDHLPAVMVVP